MKRKPVKVKLIGRKGKAYQIKFPNLKIPVTVDEYLYNKMLHSAEYQFCNSGSAVKKTYSA
ncbi:hypothetical protein [Seonamhaeicola sp. ML3]|uniref:hypothetical protein n=1 Tax=Seonamhaeicola sp. ML3 TaxID=2937786 RepID=UPI00200E1FA3|nr:hypothetical protein [Seonamhaeicola sp. ML3]